MILKVTALFNAVTVDSNGNAQRRGGWSESIYGDGVIDSQQFNDTWHQLLISRAALLPQNTTIIGQRVQTVDPPGTSHSYENVYPGSPASQNDLPHMALQWQLRSTAGNNRRPMTLPGTPDARVITGEYSPTAAYNAALSNYFNRVFASWKMRCIDRSLPRVRVISWNQGGEHICRTETAHGLVVGDVVLLYTARDSAFRKVSGRFRVATVIDATGFTVFTSANNLPCTGGKMRKEVIQYQGLTMSTEEIVSPLAVVRKIGRPFHQFRGRQSVKKS